MDKEIKYEFFNKLMKVLQQTKCVFQQSIAQNHLKNFKLNKSKEAG